MKGSMNDQTFLKIISSMKQENKQQSLNQGEMIYAEEGNSLEEAQLKGKG